MTQPHNYIIMSIDIGNDSFENPLYVIFQYK